MRLGLLRAACHTPRSCQRFEYIAVSPYIDLAAPVVRFLSRREVCLAETRGRPAELAAARRAAVGRGTPAARLSCLSDRLQCHLAVSGTPRRQSTSPPPPDGPQQPPPTPTRGRRPPDSHWRILSGCRSRPRGACAVCSTQHCAPGAVSPAVECL